jgi:hypothetical protein
MVAVIEPMVRFIQLANCASFLNITAASGYFASPNLGPFAPRSSPETPATFSSRASAAAQFSLAMQFGRALHDNQRRISQCLCV